MGVLGARLLTMTSQQALRTKPSRATPTVTPVGMPLKSIAGGAWLLGHFRRTAAASLIADDGFDDCVFVINDDPVNTVTCLSGALFSRF